MSKPLNQRTPKESTDEAIQTLKGSLVGERRFWADSIETALMYIEKGSIEAAKERLKELV